MVFFHPQNTHAADRNKDGWHDSPTGQISRVGTDETVEPGESWAPPLPTPADPGRTNVFDTDTQTNLPPSSWAKVSHRNSRWIIICDADSGHAVGELSSVAANAGYPTAHELISFCSE